MLQPWKDEEASSLLDLTRLLAAAAAIVLDDERDLITLVEAVDARALQRTGVNEHVLRSVLRLDEAEAFGGIEELDRSGDSQRAGS